MVETLDPSPLVDVAVTDAMRAEAGVRAQAHTNWTMAALITVNGGAILALLGQPSRSLLVGGALALFAAAIVCALVSGKLAARYAQLAETAFIMLGHYQRAMKFRFTLTEQHSARRISMADEHADTLKSQVETAQSVRDRASSPDPWIGAGIVLFMVACIVAGLTMFGPARWR